MFEIHEAYEIYHSCNVTQFSVTFPATAVINSSDEIIFPKANKVTVADHLMLHPEFAVDPTATAKCAASR